MIPRHFAAEQTQSHLVLYCQISFSSVQLQSISLVMFINSRL